MDERCEPACGRLRRPLDELEPLTDGEDRVGRLRKARTHGQVRDAPGLDANIVGAKFSDEDAIRPAAAARFELLFDERQLLAERFHDEVGRARHALLDLLLLERHVLFE